MKVANESSEKLTEDEVETNLEVCNRKPREYLFETEFHKQFYFTVLVLRSFFCVQCVQVHVQHINLF